MFLIDTQKKTATAINEKTFAQMRLTERYDLQEWIVSNPLVLKEPLLIIQKEFSGWDNTSERLDLLALDEQGNLVIIENKLDDSGKDVVWQALKYVSYCAALSKDDICKIYQQYLGDAGNAEEKIVEFFDCQSYEEAKINPADGDQRVILVAANFRNEVTSTVLWLRDHKIDIKCMKVSLYQDGDKVYLDSEQILPIQDIGDYQVRLATKKQGDVSQKNMAAARGALNQAFWAEALPELRKKSGIFQNISTSKEYWCSCASGYSGVQYEVHIYQNGASVGLYIDGGTDSKERNKKILNALAAKKAEYKDDFGDALDFQLLPDKRASRIRYRMNEGSITNRDDWPRMIDFLADNMAKLVKAFKPALDQAFARIASE
ncbi:MAG: DUF4268 domain-containing protein [Oscillospiraceae bacterium]|jgi:hypothetical protein|nr:DUF4268 domain-containing protein [Oscillospiraceae bacterium]